MKKIITFLICIMLCISLCACMGNKADKDVNSSGVSYEEQISSEAEASSEQETEDTNSKPKPQTSSKGNNSKNTNSKNTSSKIDGMQRPVDTWPLPSIPSDNTSSKNNSSKNNSSKVQNTSSKSQSSNFEGTGLVPGKDFGYYTYNGTFVNSEVCGDIVYSVYKEPNVLVVYDTENLKLLANVNLPAVPHEVHVDENEIMISYPRLKYVGIYSKETYAQTSKISVGYEIGSFCVTGTSIYYTELDQHCYVYKRNIGRYGLDERIVNRTFYDPKLAVNIEEGLLYIGESGITASALYYYDLGKEEIVSTYKKDGYGLTNYVRTLFVVGDSVYWAGLKFDAKSAETPIAEFSPIGRLHFANDKFIVVDKSIYDINTYQLILTFKDEARHIAITETENLLLDFHTGTLPNEVIIFPG